MANFDEAYAHTLSNEGGYVNDIDDAGGETYRGVSRRFHPSWLGWEIIDEYKKLEVQAFHAALRNDAALNGAVKGFYRANFWDRFQGDAIPDDAIAAELFDTGVNMGVHRAVSFLQDALNLLNRNRGGELIVDGKFGRNTLRALENYLRNDRREYLLKLLNCMQANHYIEYCRKSPTQEKYLRGWLKRVAI